MGLRVTKRGKDLPQPETTSTGLPDIDAELAANAELLHLAALETAARDNAVPAELHDRAGFEWTADMGAIERSLWRNMVSGAGTPADVIDTRRKLRNYLRSTGNLECTKVTGRAGIWWVAEEWNPQPGDISAAGKRLPAGGETPPPVVEALTRLGVLSGVPEIAAEARKGGWKGSESSVRNALLDAVKAGAVTRRLAVTGASGRRPYVYALTGWDTPAGDETQAEAVTVNDVPAGDLLDNVTAVVAGGRAHLRDILRDLTVAYPGAYDGWTLIRLGKELRDSGVHVMQVWSGSTNRNGVTLEDLDRAQAANVTARENAAVTPAPAAKPRPVAVPASDGGAKLAKATAETAPFVFAAGTSTQELILGELRAIRELMEKRS